MSRWSIIIVRYFDNNFRSWAMMSRPCLQTNGIPCNTSIF